MLIDTAVNQKYFIAKYSPAGNLLFFKKEGGAGRVELTGLDLLSDGTLFGCGNYYDSVTFSGSVLPENVNYSCFLIKYDSSMSVSFIKDIIGMVSLWNIHDDFAGNIYIQTYFVDTVKIANDTILYFDDYYMYSRQIVKFNNAGIYQQMQIAGHWFISISDFSADGSGAYILRLLSDNGCNHCYPGIIINKVNSSDAVIWSHIYSGTLDWANPSRTMNSSCMTTNHNKLYFAASYEGDFKVGNDSIQGLGMVIGKMDHYGNYEFVLSLQDSIKPFYISKPLHNSIIVNGTYQGIAHMGSYQLVSQNSKSGFIAKLNENSPTAIINVKNENPTFKFYPNPSQDILSVDSNMPVSQLSIKIFNSMGKMIYYNVGQLSSFRIDLSQEEKGIYFCEIKTDSKNYGYKVILD